MLPIANSCDTPPLETYTAAASLKVLRIFELRLVYFNKHHSESSSTRTTPPLDGKSVPLATVIVVLDPRVNTAASVDPTSFFGVMIAITTPPP